MRVQRRALSALAIVAVVGIGSLGIANLASNDNESVPPVSFSTPTTAATRCATPDTTTEVPSWARTAGSFRTIPHLVSPDGNVVAVLFGSPLRSGVPTARANKILWIVRQPRGGKPLKVTATLRGSDEKPVRLAFPAGSGPGEIYPSNDNVTAPGCWHLALAWNGHRSAVNLAYGAPEPSTSATSTPTTTVVTTVPPPTGCATADLDVTLGAPIGSAGHMNYEIAFRNTSTAPCTMSGFPGVSFLDANGQQTGDAARRNSLTPTPITLAPGATAYAHLSKNDLGNPPCTPDAHALRVYPPNETAFVDIPVDAGKVCGESTIDPVTDHPVG